jgi:hypothetical protein
LNIEPASAGVDVALSDAPPECSVHRVIRPYGIPPAGPGPANRVRTWEETIRTSCETLLATPSSDIAAASVTFGRDVEGEVALLCGVVEEIADEYGLDAGFKLGRDSLTVRLTRRLRPKHSDRSPSGAGEQNFEETLSTGKPIL